MALRAAQDVERRREQVSHCEHCGGRVEHVRVKVHDALIPIGLVILGSFLALYLVGVILMGAGGWLWCRKQAVPLCRECGLRQDLNPRLRPEKLHEAV